MEPTQARGRGVTAGYCCTVSALLIGGLWGVSCAWAAPSLVFEKTFNDRNEPTASNYVANYRLGGMGHRVEVWRDREQRVKRRTDDAIETYAYRSARGPEWKMVVLDLKRKIRTDVDRTNLMRIGHFSDWFSLSHSLAHPAGPYELSVLSRATPNAVPIAPCRWYLLNQGPRSSKICWSAAKHVALVVTDRDNRVEWQVVRFNSRALPERTFAIDDRDFVRNNANEDIQAD